MSRIAKQHQKDLRRYRQKTDDFQDVFPQNPGISCKFCPFSSICEFTVYRGAI